MCVRMASSVSTEASEGLSQKYSMLVDCFNPPVWGQSACYSTPFFIPGNQEVSQNHFVGEGCVEGGWRSY